MRARTNNRDQGMAMVIVPIELTLIVGVLVALTGLAHRLIDRSEAQAAADAIALAAATDDGRSHLRVAEAWGAEIVSLARVERSSGVVVTVTVAIGDETAVARASTEP